MAINVFLIVFHHYEASDLRRLEKRYFAAISALVFIPAIAFLFIHTPLKGPMYASVTVRPSPSLLPTEPPAYSEIRSGAP